MSTHQQRLDRARWALEGMSVGDAFGERLFHHPEVVARLAALGPDRDLRLHRLVGYSLPPPPWPWTDDTLMTLSVFSVLRQCGGVDQDRLAHSFARRYDPTLGYGPAMHRLLARLQAGEDWRGAARELFGGWGSFGNGAGLRVAPIGAYFADDLAALVHHAHGAAMITHTHPEAGAGAIAAALAVAWAWRLRPPGPAPSRAAFLDRILPLVPASEVRDRLEQARDLPPGTSVLAAAAALGNGSRMTVQDTVPFSLWCAAEHLADYEA
ncbi:MAG TPA: ADP-ribosylglycohydrolase family protein, partial [Chloroflexia bacterium]|nr:ADP-ribosylglycohydrolase family protein [Chloroflexia bacterium]